MAGHHRLYAVGRSSSVAEETDYVWRMVNSATELLLLLLLLHDQAGREQRTNGGRAARCAAN